MVNALVESQIEKAVRETVGESAVQLFRGVSKIAAKQGGESALENYQLLGKRALIVFGVALVTANVAISAVSFVVSRRSEEKRIEKTVRRILEEEKHKA